MRIACCLCVRFMHPFVWFTSVSILRFHLREVIYISSLWVVQGNSKSDTIVALGSIQTEWDYWQNETAFIIQMQTRINGLLCEEDTHTYILTH